MHKTLCQNYIVAGGLLAVALLCFAGGCTCPNSGVSQDEAADIVVQEVIGSADNRSIIARMWPQPLAAGDVISEGFARDDEGHVSAAPEWFVWIDDAPQALLGHEVRYAYVNQATGQVTVEGGSEAPLLNGSPLWETPADFDNQSFWIFDNLLDSFPEDNASTSRLMRARLPAGAETAAQDDCCEGQGHRLALLLYNFDNGPLQQDISDNINGMAEALGKHGFTVPEFDPSTGQGQKAPAIYLGDKTGAGLQQLRDAVAEHSGEEHCCDEVFIYYSGHGNHRKTGGEERFYFGLRFNYRGESGDRTGEKRLYAEDFAQILSELGSCRIQVLIDACYSGGFMPALAALKGVETVRVSADATEKAWGGAVDAANSHRTPDPYGRAQGEKGSEFTSGFVKGLNDLAQQRGANAEPLSAAEVMDAGFAAALENDIAAIAGKTHPTGLTRVSPCTCCDNDTGLAPGPDAQGVLDHFSAEPEDVQYQALPQGNSVTHSNGEYETAASGSTDIIGVGVASATVDETRLEGLFESGGFPCGSGESGLSVCPQEPLLKAGPYYLIFAELAADIPFADPDQMYQIGFVLDSDADAANNYQPSDAWPKDFFAGTDLWYVAEYAPAGQSWTLAITSQAGSVPVAASGARMIFVGNAVVLALPADEVLSSQARFRVTVFRHDGSYGLNGGFWNADLSSAVDESMRPLNNE